MPAKKRAPAKKVTTYQRKVLSYMGSGSTRKGKPVPVLAVSRKTGKINKPKSRAINTANRDKYKVANARAVAKGRPKPYATTKKKK